MYGAIEPLLTGIDVSEMTEAEMLQLLKSWELKWNEYMW